jgi:hypothetical protein
MAKVFAMTYDENEDRDIVEILESVKKSRRSTLLRELIRLGWQAKRAGMIQQQPPASVQNQPTTEKGKIEPQIGGFK